MLARRDRKRRLKARLFFLVPKTTPRVTLPQAASRRRGADVGIDLGFELGKFFWNRPTSARGLVELVLVLPGVDRIENGRHARQRGRHRKPKYLYMTLAFSHDGSPLPGDDWITEVISESGEIGRSTFESTRQFFLIYSAKVRDRVKLEALPRSSE